MCKPCTHTIVVQITIDIKIAFHHYFKLWNGSQIECIDIQGWKMHYKRHLIFFIEIKIYYKSKYITQVIYNKNDEPQ
jgi:hypothetical protein